MKLKNTGTNTSELILANGTTVLFSYSTPVACVDNQHNCYVTDKKYSKTTTKHINQFIPKAMQETKPQEFFKKLVGE